jgi:hypothetical protein
MTEGQLLRDRAASGKTTDVSRRDLERAQHSGGVIGHRGQFEEISCANDPLHTGGTAWEWSRGGESNP